MAIEEGCQQGCLLVAVPDEVSAFSLECRITRAFICGVAGVGSLDVLGDGGLIDHGHDGHTQTQTQRERTEQTERSHDAEDEAAARNVALGIRRHDPFDRRTHTAE